jgi:hypothetical protein
MGMARGGGGFRLLVLLLLGLACSNGGRCSWARTTLLPQQEGEAHISTCPEIFSSMPSVFTALLLFSDLSLTLFSSSGENSENISIQLCIHRIVLLE